MTNNGLKCPLFILDSSFMVELIEGRILRNKMFEEIIRRKSLDLPFMVYTTNSAFLRALFLANNRCQLANVKFILDIVKFYPGKANFKIEQEVNDELKKFAEMVASGDM